MHQVKEEEEGWKGSQHKDKDKEEKGGECFDN